MTRQELQQKVAAQFVSRANVQGMTGKKREVAAVEFVIGAAAAAAILHGEKSDEWSALSMLAFIVSTRGYAELVEVAGVRS